MIAKMMIDMRSHPNIIMCQIARSYAKMEVRERKSNRGRWVDAIVAMGGGDATDAGAWCVYFAWACAHQSALSTGMRLDNETSGGVVRSWHKNDENRITIAAVRAGFASPRPGDIMVRVRSAPDLSGVLQGGSAYGHAEVVLAAPDSEGWIHTVGGNTNGEDSAEGDGVYEKIKGINLDDDRLIGFIRPSWSKL